MVFKIITILLGLCILVLSPPLFVFCIVGFAPAIVARTINVERDKNKSSSIAFFNAAGIAIPGMRFMRVGLPSRIGEALNPSDLVIIYLMAGMGYFIVWLVPKITVIIVDYKSERRAIRIRENMAKLTEEWGPEVKRN